LSSCQRSGGANVFLQRGFQVNDDVGADLVLVLLSTKLVCVPDDPVVAGELRVHEPDPAGPGPGFTLPVIHHDDGPVTYTGSVSAPHARDDNDDDADDEEAGQNADQNVLLPFAFRAIHGGGGHDEQLVLAMSSHIFG
jgi:hypothetical protein